MKYIVKSCRIFSEEPAETKEQAEEIVKKNSQLFINDKDVFFVISEVGE